MDDINFLPNKDKGGDHKKEEKKKKEDEVEWSKPVNGNNNGGKKSSAGWSSFFRKNKEPEKKGGNLVDKNKLLESRREILKLIKQQQDSGGMPAEAIKIENQFGHSLQTREAGKTETFGSNLKSKKSKFNFFTWLNYRLGLSDLAHKIRKKDRKKILFDYQQVFEDERGKRKIVKPIIQTKVETKDEHIKEEEGKKPFKKHETAVISKADKEERIKEERIKEEKKQKKVEESDKVTEDKDWESPDILKTNLIKGEVVTFFDWRKKIIFLLNTIALACLIVGLVYGGLIFFQKRKEAENRDFTRKLDELQLQIKEAEEDVNKILLFQKRLKILEVLLARHIYWTNFFKFLEDNTIADVYYSDFTGGTGGNYTLRAVAKDYNTISEQVKVMKNCSKVVQAKVKGGETIQQKKNEQEMVKFDLELLINPEIFTE